MTTHPTPGNRASARVAEKLGAVVAGSRWVRYDGDEVELVRRTLNSPAAPTTGNESNEHAVAVLEVRRCVEADHDAVLELHDEALGLTGAHLGPGPWDADLQQISGVDLRLSTNGRTAREVAIELREALHSYGLTG